MTVEQAIEALQKVPDKQVMIMVDCPHCGRGSQLAEAFEAVAICGWWWTRTSSSSAFSTSWGGVEMQPGQYKRSKWKRCEKCNCLLYYYNGLKGIETLCRSKKCQAAEKVRPNGG